MNLKQLLESDKLEGERTLKEALLEQLEKWMVGLLLSTRDFNFNVSMTHQLDQTVQNIACEMAQLLPQGRATELHRSIYDVDSKLFSKAQIWHGLERQYNQQKNDPNYKGFLVPPTEEHVNYFYDKQFKNEED